MWIDLILQSFIFDEIVLLFQHGRPEFQILFTVAQYHKLMETKDHENGYKEHDQCEDLVTEIIIRVAE